MTPRKAGSYCGVSGHLNVDHPGCPSAPPAPPPCQHSDIDIEDLLAFGYETQWLDGTCAKCDALLRVSVSAIEVKERGV